MTGRTLGFVVPLMVLMTAATAHGAPYLGVALGDSSDERVKGAMIVGIHPDSPAAKHGLAEGDIILAVNKVETPTAEKLSETIQSLKEGDKVELKMWREGKEKTVSVTLGKRPVASTEESVQKGRLILGLAFHQPDESGTLIVAKVFPGTPAEAVGIEVGDVILELDGQRIKDYEHLRAQLRQKKAGGKVVLKIGRSGKHLEKSLVLKAVEQVAVDADPVPFDTYSGYFVSNKFEPNVAESFLVITDQKRFDEVFGVAFVMGDKSHRLPKNAFESLMVVAVVKRGSAVWDYKVESVTEANGVVRLRYSATESKKGSATFASPLIVSIPKGKYTTVTFIENGKMMKKIGIGKEVPKKGTVEIRRIDKSRVDIKVTSDRPFPVNTTMVLSIGEQKTNISRYAKNKLNILVFTMAADDFSKTQDGDAITVSCGPDSRWDFGKLDKSKVEE